MKRRVWAGLPSIHLKRDALYDVLSNEGGCEGLHRDRVIEHDADVAEDEDVSSVLLMHLWEVLFVQAASSLRPLHSSKRLRRLSMSRVHDEQSQQFK